MSSEYALRSSSNAAARQDLERRLALAGVGAAIVGTIFVIALILIGIHLLSRLDSMAANLARVNTSLETLKTMDRKLDTLSAMSGTLHQMNAKLTVTNGSLALANRQLASMENSSVAAGSSLTRMRRTLGEMQSDIHVMSHKISGSFLFRSIK